MNVFCICQDEVWCFGGWIYCNILHVAVEVNEMSFFFKKQKNNDNKRTQRAIQ